MLTTADIKKLIDVFATKGELRSEINKIREEMVTKEEFHVKLDHVMDTLDAVYSEVRDKRIEQDMHVAEHDRIDERLDKLEAEPSKI